MERKKLLDSLNVVKPSLADNNLIPVLTHFWFTGKEVMAYNDVISISAPLKTDFRGSVEGKTLSEFLSKCTASEVTLKEVDADEGDASNLSVKCGRSSIKMRLFPDDSFLFELPDHSDWAAVDVDPKELSSAMAVCLESIGNHVSEPERNAITVIPQERNKIHLYSTDSITMSHAVIDNKVRSNLPEKFIIPYMFCVTAQSLLSKCKTYELCVDDDSIIMIFDKKIKLYGRLVECLHELDFEKVFDKHLPDRNNELMVPIPKQLSLSIERAYVAVSRSAAPETSMRVLEDDKGSYIRMVARSEYGEIRDKVRISGDHKKISVNVDLKRLRDCSFGTFERMRFTKNCIVLSKGDNMYHLVSVLSK